MSKRSHTSKDLHESSSSIGAPISYLGAFIGSAMIVCGALMVLFPVDMLVYHQRIRFLSSFEHVTPGRSEFYGAMAFLLGIGVLFYSIYSPRTK